ncbi:MAG: hypothetical protein ACR2QF_10225 [Geminicoccaceae bacterium]
MIIQEELNKVTDMADRLDRLQSPEHYIKPEELRALLVSFMRLSQEYQSLCCVRDFDEWHEDFGDCVWHELDDDGKPFQSSSYVGCPNSDEWPFKPYQGRIGFQTIGPIR